MRLAGDMASALSLRARAGKAFEWRADRYARTMFRGVLHPAWRAVDIFPMAAACLQHQLHNRHAAIAQGCKGGAVNVRWFCTFDDVQVNL